MVSILCKPGLYLTSGGATRNTVREIENSHFHVYMSWLLYEIYQFTKLMAANHWT